MHSVDLLQPELETSRKLIFTDPTQTCLIQSHCDECVHATITSTGDCPRIYRVCDETIPTPPSCLAGIKIYSEVQEEFERIRKAHHTLAPTGCTPEFCQSGRAARLNEPRVGRDRPIAEIEKEAVGFLKECQEQGIIRDNCDLQDRIMVALRQIKDTSVETIVTDNNGNQTTGLAGGVWEQTTQELEYGIKASWRNSRRCIMRSKYEQLALCDLRQTTTSQGMAETIIQGMQKAFNNGRIIPTAFVFPPRYPTKRGPMLWNHQVLAFAGYRLDNESVLGDPSNVDLTKSIIELGWVPPYPKSRWDFLPIVAMAEEEPPYMAELPSELKRTIKIIHPRYKKQFQNLDLKWVLAPALSRLGFDIGGNQYTASPFIGWFMDAEIGVRNLADTFRYNTLPEVVEHLQLSDTPGTPFEDLPEFMKLAALSRAQTELNFAVYYSYLNERVTMVDTLTSSADYQKFDQEHKDETGYRLPADPHWLSPPQGSVVPLWHLGAAPNYQPKPMICRHVQDPVKAWRRESPHRTQNHRGVFQTVTLDRKVTRPIIKIFSCSAGINAGKMAKKLYQELSASLESKSFDVEPEKALNFLDLTTARPEDIILIVASTTGRGEIPRNATKFVKRCESTNTLAYTPRFSVFGNGDSTYCDTYNAAGMEIHELLERFGCRPLLEGLFTGDTALNNPDWTSFNIWVQAVNYTIKGIPYKVESVLRPAIANTRAFGSAAISTAKLVGINRPNSKGLIRVTLDLGYTEYSEMDHIKILTPNLNIDVDQALATLGLDPNEALEWHHENAHGYLSRCVDLCHNFKTLHWYPSFDILDNDVKSHLRSLKAKDVLASLRHGAPRMLIKAICEDMSSLQPRLFSVASSPLRNEATFALPNGSGNLVDMIVKVNPGGRFSDAFLLQARIGAQMRFGLTSPEGWKVIQRQEAAAPIIAITTGSGIGPIRGLLQRRTADITSCQTKGLHYDVDQDTSGLAVLCPKGCSRSGSFARSWSTCECCINTESDSNKDESEISNDYGPISLFAGFKTEDSDLIEEIVHPAKHAGLFDILELVPSNSTKVRVQDRLLFPKIKEKLIRLIRHPSCIVFVCASEKAAEATASNLSLIVRTDVRDLLQERYIEEVFRC